MKVNLYLQQLYWSMRLTIDEFKEKERKKIHFKDVNAEVENLIRAVEFFKSVVDSEEMSDEEFYNELTKYGEISFWDAVDYDAILKLAKNDTYDLHKADEEKCENDFLKKDGIFFPYTLMYIHNKLIGKNSEKLFIEQLEHTEREIADITSPDEWDEDNTRFVELYKQEYEKKNFAKRLTKVRKSL